MAEVASSSISHGILGGTICLISCLSFEERSIAAAKLMASNGMVTWHCLQNTDIETDVASRKLVAEELAGFNGVDLRFHEVMVGNPLSLADAMMSILRRSCDSGSNIVVDITTMTHEMVLIFAAAAAELDIVSPHVRVIYNLAGQYSPNEADLTRRWISRGIHQVRSVIGFPGLWAPGEPTTLLALPGFDLERVQRIAEEIEPDSIIVGIGKPGMAEHAWLYERNKRVANQLIESRSGYIFEFESLSPARTIAEVRKAAGAIDDNIVIASLNSKISTLAVGLLATHNQEWKLCYAPALIYNTDYSTPSDNFLLFSLDDLDRHARS